HAPIAQLCQILTLQIYCIGEKNNRTRLAIIINNMKFRFVDSRDGSEVDTKQMKTLLEALDYRVEVVENKTAEEMEMCLRSFSKREEHKMSDSTFVVIMSHGTEEGICGVDYNPQHSRSETILTTKAIGRIFSNDHSLNLVGKPKIIIIQACRGDHKGFVMIPTNKGDDEECLTKYDSDSPLNKIHKESDLVFFCSTTPGTRAYRHRKNGTMFIQRLVETFRNHAWNFHIEDLFKKVQRSFHNFPQQLPCKERTTLLRNFYLFPGH
uniref:Uncharacterized protein n=1 Tax=Lepisosteus oculatus TaxID=7918 RepID=W5MFE7_LEPOC